MREAGHVDITFTPAEQTVTVGDIVEIDLVVSTSDEFGQAFAGMDVLLSWDPAVLELLGVDQSGAGTPLFVSAFLPDPDGINFDLTDGDALYTALAPPGEPAIAPGAPNMLVVTTLQFRALQPSAPTALVMLSTFGTFGKTQVLFSGKDFTGDISSISETTVDAIVGDLDNDSVVDGADLGILLGSWGPCEGCPADLNGNGIVDGADLGMLLSAWTP